MAQEKKATEELEKQLLARRKNGYFKTDEQEVKKAYAFTEGYKSFLNEAKTEREAVAYAKAAAQKAGFVPFEYGKEYKAGDKVYYNNRGKSICLAVIGKNGAKNGVRICAAHIDSPRIDLKPIPLYETNEIAMFKTHYYGGLRKYQWVAMPLAMHGTVVKRNGEKVEIRLGEKEGEPRFCITDLLPHLAKEQSEKPLASAFTGEDLNVTVGSVPEGDEEGKQVFKLHAMKLLAEAYGITEEDFLSAEIEFVPAFPAVDVGMDRSFIGGYGHDDRVCAYPALEAILDISVPEDTVITVLTDKEETGSDGNSGLNSDYLRYFISDLAENEGLNPRHVLSKSTCLSADVTAAFDPNYPSVFEPANSCYVNYGVGVCKYTGARGKGNTSEASAEFTAQVRKIFDEAGVLWQMGELGRVDQGGGGTVARYVARLNIDVIDVGVPVLSMHSPFELVSKLDVYMAYKGFRAFFEAKS